jgi:hypothetical protein
MDIEGSIAVQRQAVKGSKRLCDKDARATWNGAEF